MTKFKIFILCLVCFIGIQILIQIIIFFIRFIQFKRKGYKISPQYPALKKESFFYRILIKLPIQLCNDLFLREAYSFNEQGIYMFCGEQGSGKTISAVQFIDSLQKRYKKCKVITNFNYINQNHELNDWHQLIDYTNGKQGVIVGIDEIQNWFMSGKNQLPPEMLEVVTQDRKNHRAIVCTAQVFTRVNKAIREQVSYVFSPLTVFGCLTFVVKRKPKFDDEGVVIGWIWKGIYFFVHSQDLRNKYDTYQVIHTLSKDGFDSSKLLR